MKIIDSTKIKFLILCFISVFPLLGHAELNAVTNFKGADVQLETRCAARNGVDNCVVYSKKNEVRKKIISFPFAPSNIEYRNGVFVVVFPCGTACSATYFYKDEGRLGGPFPLVESFDAERGVVLSISNNTLKMYRMFSRGIFKPIGDVPLNVKADVELMDAILDVKLKDHTFLVTYTDQGGNAATVARAVPSAAGR